MSVHDDLISRARIVCGLWDGHLFSVGMKEARLKKSDIMHVAVENLQAAIMAVEVDDLAGSILDPGKTGLSHS